MNALKNIQWVALVTFLLGYIVSTAVAGGEAKATPPITPPSTDKSTNEVKPTDSLSRWQPVSIANSMPRRFANTRPNVITRASALTKVFDILCKSDRPLRILQIGDSHVAGADFPRAVRTTLEAAWGAATDTATSGVVYQYIAKNGAIAKHFATAERMHQVSEANPDLIILSFGTNECHGMGYREELHRTQLQALYDLLTETCPEAVIMLTTPPGDYLVTRRVRYTRRNRRGKSRRIVRSVPRVNPMSVRCAAELENFGATNGLPVWNLNTIVGGTYAVRNWTASGLMQADRIHFTPEGYVLHGRLLAEAILTAYNDYLKN